MNHCYDLFGIECEKGWESLYAPLIERCQKEGVKILQIKEKFGGLRFYVDTGSTDLFRAIDAAEDASFKICEQCGAPGKLRSGGWLKTRCDECQKKHHHEKTVHLGPRA